jgi:hypothetical protein
MAEIAVVKGRLTTAGLGTRYLHGNAGIFE